MMRFFAMLVPALLLASGCVTPPVSTLPDPHHHTIAVHGQRSSPEHVKDMEAFDPNEVMIRVPKSSEYLPNFSGSTVAALGTMIHHALGYPVPVIVFFHETRSYVCFISHTWPNRIIDRLEWVDDRRLAFDLFAGDGFGWHYIIDSKSKKAVFATPFADGKAEDAPKPTPR